MNKKFKKALQTAFDAPIPTGKEAFLKKLRYPKTTYRDFLLSQFCYIRKWVWFCSALIVLLCIAVAFLPSNYGFQFTESGMAWSISALLPFMALLTATELYRSAFYRMSELELCCRFSLSQIIMARILILGGGNFVLLTLILTFLNHASSYPLLQAAVYLLVPYLITCGACLLVLNRIRSRESIYICAFVSCLVSMANIICSNMIRLLYSSLYLNYWLILFAISGVFLGIQLRNLLKHMEDKTWNFLLTE